MNVRLALNGILVYATCYNDKKNRIYFTVDSSIVEQLIERNSDDLQVYFVDTDERIYVPEFYIGKVGDTSSVISMDKRLMRRTVEVMYNHIEDLQYVD